MWLFSRPRTVYYTVKRTRNVYVKIIYCCSGWKKSYSSSRECTTGTLTSPVIVTFMKFSIAAYFKIYPMNYFILLLAICSQGCNSNHGSCVAPNRCQCSSGWTGSTCSNGTLHLHCMHVLLLTTFSSLSFPWVHINLINHNVLQQFSFALRRVQVWRLRSHVGLIRRKFKESSPQAQGIRAPSSAPRSVSMVAK